MKRLLLLGLSVVSSVVALTAGPAPGATNLVPAELAGTWTRNSGAQFLTLAGPRFAFFSPDFPDFPAMGAVSVSGNTVTFYSSNRCNGTGTYQWSLSDGRLTFVQVPGSNDPCARAVVLTSAAWTHRSG